MSQATKVFAFLQIKLGKQHDALCIAEQGRARGLVDLLSAKYGIENASGSRALNLNAIKELVPEHQADMLLLGNSARTYIDLVPEERRKNIFL